MAGLEPPYFGLGTYGREPVPFVVFTASRDRAEFLRLADWLCGEFAAEVTVRYGFSAEDS